MKKISILLFLFTTSFVVAQKSEKVDTTKTYLLSQVDEAPKLLNYSLRDSLTSVENFKRNLRIQVAKNTEIITGPTNTVRAFVQFIVKTDGKVEVINARGTSKEAIEHATKAVQKIKKMIPAKKDGKAVAIKFTIPIKFNTINIGTMQE